MRILFVLLVACGAAQADTLALPEPQSAAPLPQVSATPEPSVKPARTVPSATATKPPDNPDVLAAARQLFMEGVQAFDAGDYSKALRKFEDAWVLAPRGPILVNMGRALEALGRKSQAADRYEEYVRDNPTAPNSAEIDQKARALRAQP